MVKLVAIYTTPEDVQAFENHYREIHTPLVRKMPGLQKLEVAHFFGAPQGEPRYYMMAEMYFDDKDALFAALKDKRIAGAALDCFADEPVISPHRFGELPNVILAPHSIAWTNELFRDIGCAVFQGMIDLSQGRKPKGVLNPELFEDEEFIKKWKRFQV